MNVAYTDKFVLNGEVVIKKGVTPGNGVIPDTVSVTAITIASASNVTFAVKGLNANAAYADVESGQFTIEGLDDNSPMYFYVKTTSGITMNLFVKGQV